MSTILKPKISEQERAQRKASIDSARGSVRLEGFILGEEVEALNQRYIDGELTCQEHVEAIKRLAKHA